MSKQQTKNREAWLMEGVRMLTPLFEKLNKKIPNNLRASCGFPSKSPFGKHSRIGECWNPLASSSKTNEIFISPIIYEPIEVLGVLVHEVVHSVVGTEHQHKGMFKVVARAIGLDGKLTATTVGERLKPELEKIHKALGDYPHSKLDKTALDKEKKPSSSVKIICSECEYKVMVSKKLVAEYGYPTCPCGTEMSESV